MKLYATYSLAFFALLLAPVAQARDTLPLRLGSSGPRVAGLQWMLGGHRPNVFTLVKPTYKFKPNGYWGPRTATAVVRYKYELGYPQRFLKPVAGAYFFDLLRGTKTRPPGWVEIAAFRIAKVVPGITPLGTKIKNYEVHLVSLNIHEIPDGSNRGPAISYPAFGVPALQSATGAYGLAWCMSSQQTIFKLEGYGTFAGDTAGVYVAADIFARENLLHVSPKPGALVLFVDYDQNGNRIPGTGHVGYVILVYKGGYESTEGNQANGFHAVYHGLKDRGNIFAWIPGVTI